MQESLFDTDTVSHTDLSKITYPLKEPPDETESKHMEMNFRDLTTVSDSDPLTHSLQKHPATFIPHIPRYLIQTTLPASKECTVLDCFSGRGTTGVETLLAGHSYLGIEINPLSHLVSSVATKPLPPELLSHLVQSFVELLEGDSYSADSVTFPGRTKKSHWFETTAIQGLEDIRGAITEYSVSQSLIKKILTAESQTVCNNSSIAYTDLKQRCQNVLVLTLANTVFETSNADPGVSKAYKSPKMKEQIDTGAHPPDPIETFKSELETITDKIGRLWSHIIDSHSTIPQSTVVLGDSRDFELPDHISSIDLTVTSPPYINAINYYRGSKLRLFWIQDKLPSEITPSELRDSIIGSNSSVHADQIPKTSPNIQSYWTGDTETYQETNLPQLQETIDKIYMSETSSAQKKAVLTEHFFMRDMAQTLANIYSYLSDSGLFFFVVGNNVIEDQPIDLHTYLQSISGNLHQLSTTNIDTTYTHLGSAFDIITNRELFQSRNHDGGVIECEWVLALEK